MPNSVNAMMPSSLGQWTQISQSSSTHFVGGVPQPVLVLAEHCGDEGMMNLGDPGQGLAAAATMADALGVQFRAWTARWVQVAFARAVGGRKRSCVLYIYAATWPLAQIGSAN